MNLRHLLPLLLLIANLTVNAAEEPDTAAPKLKAAPTGRLLMDAGVFTSNQSKDFRPGVDVPDIGVGIIASYGPWTARIDIGYTFGKVALKDVYVQKQLTPQSYLRIGNFVHQFGLQAMTGSAMKISMEEPTPNEALGYMRLLGVMYNWQKGPLYASASLHAETKAMVLRANELHDAGYGAITRLVWRPLYSGENIVQAGISGAISGAQYDEDPALSHHVYNVNANFPTRIDLVSAVDATVTDARLMAKFTPELLLMRGPLALESQYYWLQVSRRNHLEPYRAYGAYGLLRWLAVGGDYKYSMVNAAPVCPGGKSLELVAGYNYACLTSERAGIYGGRISDASLTANWYINKFMIWRLRAAYTYRWDRTSAPDTHLGSLQTRLQFIF